VESAAPAAGGGGGATPVGLGVLLLLPRVALADSGNPGLYEATPLALGEVAAPGGRARVFRGMVRVVLGAKSSRA